MLNLNLEERKTLKLIGDASDRFGRGYLLPAYISETLNLQESQLRTILQSLRAKKGLGFEKLVELPQDLHFFMLSKNFLGSQHG